LKVLSQRRREEIFQVIETNVEKSNEYNLQRILESFASKPISTSLRAEEEEVIYKVRIPPFLRLFPLGMPDWRKFSLAKRKSWKIKPRRVKPIKPVRPVRTRAEKVEPQVPQEIVPEEVSTPPRAEVLPESEFYYKLDVDIEKAREYVENSFGKTHRFLFVISILSTLILIGIGIGVGIVQYLFSFNQSEYFSCYYQNGRIECYFYDYLSVRDVEDILFVSLIVYASIIAFYILMKIILGILKWSLRQKIGKIIMKCQVPMLEYEIDELGRTVRRFFYEGIINSDILEV
jgi:hypothetical protein